MYEKGSDLRSGSLVLIILISAAVFSGGWAFGSELVCTTVSLPGNLEVPTLCIEKKMKSGPTQGFVKTKYWWDLEIMVNYTDSKRLTDVVVTDTLPAEIDLDSYTSSTGTVEIRETGATHITWSVGTLNPGDSETLTLKVTNNENPAGKQRWTEAGNFTLNSGAKVEGTHKYRGKVTVITAGPTDPITVEIIE